ncbi:MAG: BatA domain-containing protein [Phycisphaerae bacterium]|nr:BatA domain-containing protein [Phycisphaerae bacterium]
MTFVSAMFLLGALGVAGPIVVHLLARPKFKRLPFTMLRFLREGQSESQARRRIRDWIILLMRCLIIGLIAILFARPIWQTHSPRPAAHEVWFVGLDNSLSMTVRSQGADLLTTLKTQAKDRIRTCPEDSEFHVFFAGDNQWFAPMNQAQALALVHGMAPAQAPAQFGEFLRKVRSQSRTLDEETRVNVVLGSDFSPDVIMGLRGLMPSVGVDQLQVLCVQPDPGVTNAGIVNASVSAVGDQTAQIHVTLRNTGTQAVTRRLTTLPHDAKAPVEVTLLPDTYQVCAVTCPLPSPLASPQASPLPEFARGRAHTITVSFDGPDDFDADDEIQLNLMTPDQGTRHCLLVDQRATDRLFLFKTAIESLADVSLGVIWDTRCVTLDNLANTDLAWADTIVLAGVSEALIPWIEPLKRGVIQGKRLVCFMTELPESTTVLPMNQSGLWPVTWIEPTPESTQPEIQPQDSEWTDSRAGESLIQYGLDRMVLRESSHVRLEPEAQCVWRCKNGAPFVALRSLGQGVSIWINTSVDASLSALAKSPGAVAWAQYLVTSGQGSSLPETHDTWRDCEPVLQVTSPERIDQVTRALFHEGRSAAHEPEAASAAQVTHPRPLWRETAWLLLVLMLLEPFVAERIKP